MDEKNKLKRTVLPYIILASVLICTALILSELWGNVSPLVPHPWEGPTPTATLWWRSSRVTPSGFQATSTPTGIIKNAPRGTKPPYQNFFWGGGKDD